MLIKGVKTMNISRRFFLATVFVVSFSAICYSQDIAIDFDQVVRPLLENAVRFHPGPHYFDMEDPLVVNRCPDTAKQV